MAEKICDICKDKFDEWLEFHHKDGTVLTVCYDCMACYPNEVNEKLDYIEKHLRS